MGSNKLWEDILEIIKSELSTKAFNTWFKNSHIEVPENNKLVIYVANEFAADWVRKNYSTLLKTSAEKLLEKEIEISILSEYQQEATGEWGFLL